MQKLKRLGSAATLAVMLVTVTIAGETNSPPCAAPGEMNTPPCPSLLASNEPTAPGEIPTPPASDSFSVVSLAAGIALDLLLF